MSGGASLKNWTDHVAEIDGCLVWQGRIDANGYARIGSQWAHRAIYELEVGPIPDGHELDHLCTRPSCVYPQHLDPVTRAEHCRRTVDRSGKTAKHISAAYLRALGMTYGEIADFLDYSSRSSAAGAVRSAINRGLVDADSIPPAPRLTDQDSADIQDLRAAGVSVRDIASWYGIHEAHASRVSRGLTGGHST